MVIEFLTFSVPPDELDEWLAVEEQHWSRFLEWQDGFVRKEMWRSHDDPSVVHAAIWWESMEHWKSVRQEDVDHVIAAMGAQERRVENVSSFDLLREG